MIKNHIGKILAVGIIVLIISTSFISNTNAKILSDRKSIEKTKDNYNLIFCFVESGYVRHENVSIIGFNLSYPFSFCIGSIKINLKSFNQNPEETRLSIKRLSGNYYFRENITVLLKGFIGRIQPTGSVSNGFLKGFALVTLVTTI